MVAEAVVSMEPNDVGDDCEDSELAPREVHYHQTKNGNGDASRLNTILLVALLGIIGFVGAGVWGMNERLARVETNVDALMARP